MDEDFSFPEGNIKINCEEIVTISKWKKSNFLGIVAADVELGKKKKKSSKTTVTVNYLVALKAKAVTPAEDYGETSSDSSSSSSDSAASAKEDEGSQSSTSAKADDSSESTSAETDFVYCWAKTKAQKALLDARTRHLFWIKHGKKSITGAAAAREKMQDLPGTLPERHDKMSANECFPKYLFGEDRDSWKAGMHPASVQVVGAEKKRGAEIQRQKGSKKAKK